MVIPVLLAIAIAPPAASIHPVDLRCEELANPEGIDIASPRLSWKLTPTSPGLKNLKQVAYRIVVGSRPDRADAEGADVWDSGRVLTDETTQAFVPARGLTSGKPYWWRVQVWDQNGAASEWSPAAKWSMGILNPREWKAKWIGFDAPLSTNLETEPNFSGAKWIWHNEGDPAQAPKGDRFFRTTIVVPPGTQSTHLYATADDHFDLELDGKLLATGDGKGDSWRRPVSKDLTGVLAPGRHLVMVRGVNSGVGNAGLLMKFTFRYPDGNTSTYVTAAGWESSENRNGPFQPVRVLGDYGMTPWGRVGGGHVLPPPRYFRKEFALGKPIARAVAHVSALGMFEFRLNGKKISDEHFMPGWTDYEKRVYYRTYDVTKSLKRGDNAAGIILGDGWYAGYIGYGNRREHYGPKTRAFAQIDVTYADGASETIATGPDWRAQTGPIAFSDFLMGETYDARKEIAGWDQPGFRETDWKSVDVGTANKGTLEAFPGNPVRAYDVLRSKTITKPTPDDSYVLDLGQNMAGWARLRVRGRPGQKIVLRFAERLNPDGTIYITNLRGAKATDTYICKGQGTELWEPRFTFHGFQYIEVSGLGRKPGPEDVVGIPISSDTPRVGTLETSSPMLNKLVSNAWWTQRMNFIDIPTDCPQRDERLGWTGDAQAYARTATMLDDVQAFFKKWLVSLDDAQRDDGQFPMVAPLKVAGADGGPGWADAGVICPWTIYDAYGDERLLARHYPQMKRFIEFMVKRSTPDLLPPAQFHCFGDWVSIGATTPTDVIYNAYFAHSANLLSKAAAALGKSEDARMYQELFGRLKQTFAKAYVSADGTIKGDTQCAYVMAIAFDLLSPEMAKIAAQKLVADIEKRGWKLTTGFLGTRDIMNALSKIGRNDVAFRLLHSTEFPSWGFTIKNGATSIWERWDGWTPEKGFQDPGMNSFAHYAFGAVVGWMADQIPGIRNSSPGYRTVRIAPQIDPNLKWAKGSYDSIRGKIVSEWSVEGGKVKMRVVIPPNVTAEVHVPGKGVERVGSGEYRFEGSVK
ncbi:MAG TPA: glycoside hydrolase family 78 protein [Fimbriimonadaceae bacterium]|nr:glycoside hydrolase family 78 protein [Fimbriimonadaceae bacterium]